MDKRRFIDLARKGWEALDYAQGDFYPDWNTLAEPQPSQACAMVAAAYAAGMCQSVGAFIDRNGLNEVATIIYMLSDAAGSKQAAIDALEENLIPPEIFRAAVLTSGSLHLPSRKSHLI